MKAVYIKVVDEGEYEVTEIDIDPTRSLRTLQELVGGLIEFAPTDEVVELVLNEEGLYLCPHRNFLAELLWSEHDPYGCLDAGNTLRGNIVVLGPTDDEGNSTSVPDGIFTHVQQLAIGVSA